MSKGWARSLIGHRAVVRSVAVLPDGYRAVSGSDDGTVRVWDLKTGTELRQLVHERGVNSIAVHPDGAHILSGARDGIVRLWDLETGRELRRFEGHTGYVWTVAAHADGKLAISGSEDCTVRLWNLDTGAEMRTFQGHTAVVRVVKLLPDGRRAVSRSDDYTIRVWDLAAGSEVARFDRQTRMVSPLVILQDGHRVLSASAYGIFRLWDIDTGVELRRFKAHMHWVRSLAVLPDGQRVISGSSDGTVRLWDLETGLEAQTFEGHLGGVLSVAALPDGKRALSGSEDHTIRVWELEDTVEDPDSIRYTTARIVLLGDSGVGKSGLGWRIAHREFREQKSTHGRQFLVSDGLNTTRRDGTKCEVVLWDLAGQPDYRLTHALFLYQAHLGLLVFDSTNRERPLAGVEYWLRHLRAATGRANFASETSAAARAPTLLVAARADRGTPTLASAEIEAFCKRHEIADYIVTSAWNDTGVPDLIEKIKAVLPWDRLTATTTTRTFKRIKDHVLKLKEAGVVTLLLPRADLRRELEAEASDREWDFTDNHMMTAVGHLENHGYVTRLGRASGEEVILLAPDILANLASSIVLEARRHERGLGLLDEVRLLTGDYRFPELDGLSSTDCSTLLDAAANVFLRHNLCLRESLNDRTCLVFPSLINEKRPTTEDSILSDDASYRVSGAVENVYTALVVQLGYTNLFRRDAHWQNQAQYELEPGEICGFRQIDGSEGEIELVLSFSPKASEDTRKLFQGAFERFLKRRAVEIRRLPMVACPRNGHRQLRDLIRQAVDNCQEFFFCPRCGDKITTPQIDEIGVSADTVVHKAVERVDKRTQYEAAVGWVKSFRRDRGEVDRKPNCFISYAWGDPRHERWVEQLADHLKNADVAIILDRWDNQPGTDIARFVERISRGTDFVCAIGTPQYRLKDEAEDTDRVVQAELRLIKSKLMSRDQVHDTVIPLLAAGTKQEAFPPLLQGSVFVDFRKEADFFLRLFELVLTIHRIPFANKMSRQYRDELSGVSEIGSPARSREARD